ncbi:hypothetical protein BDV38DRAFT_258256, partial [Aspergillus pseudotamarii]
MTDSLGWRGNDRRSTPCSHLVSLKLVFLYCFVALTWSQLFERVAGIHNGNFGVDLQKKRYLLVKQLFNTPSHPNPTYSSP